MKRLLLFLLLLLLAFTALSMDTKGAAVITGAFIQLDGQLSIFSEVQWKTELGFMKAVGMDTVVIQYSAYGERYYYPSKYMKTTELGQDESLAELLWKGSGRARYVRVIIEPTSVEWTMIAEIAITKDGSPISIGDSYSIKPTADPAYPDDNKLTDGSANYSWGDMVGWKNPPEPIEITIDLGEVNSFNGVSVKFMRSEISNVQLPTGGFTISVSNDGDSFMLAGEAIWAENAVEGGTDAIENILKVANELGMDVFLGLGLNPEYWSGKFDAKQESSMNQKIMTELKSLYGNFDSLAGWYLPEELDDRNFNTPSAKNTVKTYLKNMMMYARFYTGKPVMVSPYFGMNPNGAAYAEWWDEILSEVKIDIVAMQDGVGTRRTTVEESTAVFEALQPVMEKHGVEFWANVEVFNQIHGWPVDESSWQAVPADIERVLKQLELQSPYVEKVIIFDFPHYMSPRLGGKATELYNEYEEYIETLGE